MNTKSTLHRLDEMRVHAIETFGSKADAEAWLHKENLILGATPISMAKSDSGLIEVKKILTSISYGGVV